jgi:hypothetical protein
MSRYREIFSKRYVVLPVIPVESRAQALRNTVIAHEQGCDGVFLINHDISYPKLLKIHHQVSEAFPDWWIGANCLDLSPRKVFAEITHKVAGVWVDNAEIDERVEHQPVAEKIVEARARSGWLGLYFGGVAFKYQRHVNDVRMAARIAAKHMDVVTTSGPGTGQAADRDTLQTMKEALGSFPLAIASGITSQNIGDYLDTADCFLVFTGISKSRSELDPELVKGLLDRIR